MQRQAARPAPSQCSAWQVPGNVAAHRDQGGCLQRHELKEGLVCSLWRWTSTPSAAPSRPGLGRTACRPASTACSASSYRPSHSKGSTCTRAACVRCAPVRPSSHAVSWACLPIAGFTTASQPQLGFVEPQPCIHPSWAALKVLHGIPQILHAAAAATCCSSTISRCAFGPASRAADCMLVL